MKNILITGGAGFIGQRLAARLLEKGYAVTLLDNLSEQIHGKISVSEIKEKLPEGSSFIYGDVLNKQLLKELIVSHNYLIHLAAETGTGQSMYEIEHYVNVNINATAAIMDILTNEKHSMEKVLVASSRAIYGEGKYSCRKHGVVYPDHRLESDLINGDFNVKCPQCHENVDLLPTDEQSKIHPSSIYGITKQVQEQLVMVTGKAIGLPVCALRYQNVYGPGQSLKNPYTGILSIFSTRIFNNNSINIFEDGMESRDFVYIDDVVEGTILALESEAANYEVFNIGSGQKESVVAVVNELMYNYGVKPNYEITGNYRIGDIRHNVADLRKAKSLLGFSPKTPFTLGIKAFAKWAQNEEIPDDNFDVSIDEMKKKGLLK